ncbi:hypothetical protein A2715_00820 [Candidatus Woesebacteria bacterium RIFCSPHIGHO2_01_FULL_39_32]|uniref:Uncharacterized protein n=1 Tax=Candidatus Woesebacteria bacterium RIFCSPLOWO2_01_FULL_39_25 TaxID=1802521 RepID=A0A1F8BIA3_9BACT|nr:MAG: hypothetical protein A2124_03620 [Candidatus Woesebacteria bacterium GWB1_37_5]OGM24456.1 MAG: hypothetical protein A2715_00820 [Candidatus Woesebacteria bacterium RIFCSPHIGHO2_01_FULL_39_32]OGM36992.1 MAG: hypothetical protein A3F01_05125 [Candidatus Woesebacteria bacterium RIFCSPHIGHO2_12_FULL_38_11]OGM63762.1 MAG: hypothetical protein A2893_02155 [Candidatus Woesebacteria bacterium RIFCSPLOWO2_01_FULL_39_25]
MTAETQISLRQVAEDGYYRLGISKEAPWGMIPSWVWSVGIFASLAEESRRKVEMGEAECRGLTEQTPKKFKVISQSLRFSNEEDIASFEALITSIRHFWPQVGSFKPKEAWGTDREGNRHLLESDPHIFVRSIEGWLKGEVAPPIRTEAVSVWFDSIGGLACSDPAVVRKYFSSAGVYRILPLAGWEESNGKEKRDGRPLFQEEVRGTWAFDNLRTFAGGCAELLEKRANEIMTSYPRLAEQLQKIAISARDLEEFLKYSWEGNYKEMDLLRPTPPENILVPVGVALAERLSNSQSDTEDSQIVESIARSLVRVFRRRRVSINKEGILGFCSAFRDSGKVIGQYLPLEGGYAGFGLEIVNDWSGGNKETIDKIQNWIIPEFIFQMRLRGYNTFDWTKDDYRTLGLSEELWGNHQARIEEERKKTIPGREIVQSGDSVIEFSGELDPLHEGHIQFIWEAAEDIDIEELARAGFMLKNSEGRLLVGVSVNTGNKGKQSTDAAIRNRIVEEGLAYIGNVFIHTGNKTSLPTAQRMDGYRAEYEDSGAHIDVQARLAGFNKPNGPGFTYTEIEEPGGSKRLNDTAHIFSLQQDDLIDPYDLCRRIRAAFGEHKKDGEKFDGKVIVMLVHLPEVHSSYIREHIDKLSDEVLATLVHPRDIPTIRELYSRTKV